MKIAIHTTDGGQLDIKDFDQGSFMELLDEFGNERTTLLSFALDTGMAYVVKAAVVRIDTFD
ncbi:hypothetical protein ASF74_07880 [Arthrobacter sp. Leaf145]|nr:hypothetical protein ASF74_07880 [Arthrobacter sp. Leaf145]